MKMYRQILPADCKTPSDDALPQPARMSACEHNSDSAFLAWWVSHGKFNASWTDSDETIADAAWQAALEWADMARLIRPPE